MRRRALGVLAFGLLAAAPAVASANGLDLRIGGFFPRADSNLFRDDFELYNVDKSSFYGVTGGIEYNVRLARNVELGVSLDGYSRTTSTSYRDYVRSGGDEIRQQLRLSIVPVGFTLRVVPTGRHARVAPYVGVGADLLFWRYEEFGDFVDFYDPDYPIYSDEFVSEGVVPGVHVTGGLRVPLNEDVSVVAEGRYQWGKDDNMGGDFFRAADKNQLDLSGASATIGIHIRF